MQNRFKSKVLWASIIAQVLALMQMTGLMEAIGLDAGLAGDIGACILQLLVLVGVLNNPTDGEKW